MSRYQSLELDEGSSSDEDQSDFNFNPFAAPAISYDANPFSMNSLSYPEYAQIANTEYTATGLLSQENNPFIIPQVTYYY